MTKTLVATLAFAAVALSTACAPAANTPANSNSNANTAKPAAAAPTADTFMAMEQKANDAYTKADKAHFETILADKAIMSFEGKKDDRATIISHIGSVKCEGVSTKLSEPQMLKIDDNTYVFTYKNDSTGKCDHGDGKMMDMMPARASTLWVRSGSDWKAAWHGETMIIDPKNPPAPPKTEVEKAPAGDAKSADTKPGNTNANSNANTAAPAKSAPPAPSANTDALAKLHMAGWEAFKSKDAKYFDTNLSSSFGFVDPIGGYIASKADAVKEWTGGGKLKCEGITKVNFADAFAWSVSPTVEILFGKGTADGTCDGMKNGDLYQTSIYVKEGDTWKLAFMAENPPMPGM